jgi:predicted dehydrogenase
MRSRPPPPSGASGGLTLPRLGFLGVGWIGRHRLEAVASSGLATIAAIADASAEAAAAARDVAPEATLVTSLDDLLALDLDGVVIATPSALHAEQAIAALRRELAVFCQKPLARTSTEAREVVVAAEAADRLLGVDMSYRFTEGMQRIRALIQAGALGAVYAVDLVFHNAYGPDKAWFHDPALSGGGCLMDLGIHLVDLALWALDFPAVVATTGRRFAAGRPLADRSVVEDYATARLDLASGAAVQLACSWRLPAGCDAVIGAAFYGTNGGAALRNVNGSFYDFTAERYQGTAREVLAAPPDAWGGRAVVDWVARLAAGERFDAAAWQPVEVASVLDRLYAS